MAIAIRSPVREGADRCRMRPPDPTEIVRVGPIAVSVEILCAPNVLVVILDVVPESLREVTLGEEMNDRRVVVSGVEKSDHIVLDGAFHLNNQRKQNAIRGGE